MRSTHIVATVLGLAIGSIACAPPEAPVTQSARHAANTKTTSSNNEERSDDVSQADEAMAAAESARRVDVIRNLTVSFAGKAKSKVYRVCSDKGASVSRATLADATGVALARVDNPTVPIAPLDAPGAPATTMTIAQLKTSVETTGVFSIPVKETDLSATPTLYAIIGYGDNFGGPPTASCNFNVAPPSSGDVEQFPANCAVLGYVQASWDAARQQVIATPQSQFLLGANTKDSQSDFGMHAPPNNQGCDDYDSPLVLDLGGHGVTLGAVAADVFDIDGDGTRDRVAWITSDETPLLARDANGNGVIDGIDELFGNRTRIASGRTAANGFEALAAYDGNGDGVIDARDPVWASLRLWFDRNHDGRTDAGELVSLAARGIRSIAVAFTAAHESLTFDGASVGSIFQRGAATRSDGSEAPVVDVWFKR